MIDSEVLLLATICQGLIARKRDDNSEIVLFFEITVTKRKRGKKVYAPIRAVGNRIKKLFKEKNEVKTPAN